MATFISLINLTEQGVKNVKESPRRAEAFKSMAASLGVTVKALYWTVGRYDLVVVTEGPEEAAATALMAAGSLGNVRTETMRAFNEEEISRIVGNIP